MFFEDKVKAWFEKRKGMFEGALAMLVAYLMLLEFLIWFMEWRMHG